MKFLIIRHGEPDYENDSLTEKGFREAELLSQKLCKENISKIYCSPLGRAQKTAKPTAEKLGLPVNTLEWLMELPVSVKTQKYPNGECPWNLPPSCWSNIDGIYDRHAWKKNKLFAESNVPSYCDNVCEQLDALFKKHGYLRKGLVFEDKTGVSDSNEVIALFCHFALGGVLLSHITHTPLPQWWYAILLPTSSVTTVFMEQHIENPQVVVARLTGIGDTAHLYSGREQVSGAGLHNPDIFGKHNF